MAYHARSRMTRHFFPRVVPAIATVRSYACLMPKQKIPKKNNNNNNNRTVSWSRLLVSTWRSRSLWSATSGTTDPEAALGVVTLAASGGEVGGAPSISADTTDFLR